MSEDGMFAVKPEATAGMTLRRVIESDLKKLFLHRNQPGTRQWLEYAGPVSMEMHYAWFKNRSHDYFIIEKDNQPIGLARLRMFRTEELTPPEAEIGLDLFEEHRGKHLSRDALRLIEEHAVAMGAKRLSLWVFVENVPAMRIYVQQGFQVCGDVPVRWFVRVLKDFIRPCAYVRMTKNG